MWQAHLARDPRAGRPCHSVKLQHYPQGHCLKLIRITSLVCVPRESASCFPSREKANRKMRSEVKSVNCFAGAINGLRPEVRNATAGENVNNRAAVCGPGQVRAELSRQGKCLDGWSTLKWDDGKLDGGILILKIKTNDLFSIG